jgi:hypothetical protein
MDDVRGEPEHREHHLAAGRQGQQLHAAGRPGQRLDNAGEIFAWQHDPEALGNGIYTFFDNDSAGTPQLPYSRAVTVRLDLRRKVATLLASDDQPEGLSAPSQGNAQTTGEGKLFVGWGALPYSRSSTRGDSSYSTPSSQRA